MAQADRTAQGLIAYMGAVVIGVYLIFFGRQHDWSIFFDNQGIGVDAPGGYLGAFAAAALIGMFPYYGFEANGDVAEEITRLQSHLHEIERLLGKGGEIGKRLDFLIQELHREANTLGSKSAAMELTRISVDMKVLIEQMREQVQNIE